MFFGENFNLFFYRWLFFFRSFSLWLFDEMKWLRWFGWRKKGSRIFSDLSTPSQLLCRNNRGGNHKKLFKNHMHEDGATEWQFGHISGAERRQKASFGDDGGLRVGLTTALIIVCPAHFVFALVSWPHWTGNAREDWQEVLSAGSAKIKLLDKKCSTKKKEKFLKKKKEKQFAVRPISCLLTTRNSPISGIIIFLACENVKSIVHK